MANGRLTAYRQLALGAAWLQTSKANTQQIDEYLRCGAMGDTSRNDVEPYDPEVVKALAGKMMV